MKEAIQKAIEGGWETKHNFNDWGGEIMSDFANEALLDPLFWQALGKALGWGHCLNCGDSGEVPIGENRVTLDMAIDAGDRSLEGTLHSVEMGQCEVCGGTQSGDYLYHWHRFIDHLAEGKDAESFFSSLLNEK